VNYQFSNDHHLYKLDLHTTEDVDCKPGNFPTNRGAPCSLLKYRKGRVTKQLYQWLYYAIDSCNSSDLWRSFDRS
jgi:hypothetical protein